MVNDWKESFPQNDIYFETENGILYCGDCVSVMELFPRNSIDLIITSPPYNVGIKYDNWNDELSINEYFRFVKRFLNQFKRVLTKDGRFVINVLFEGSMYNGNGKKRLSLVSEYYLLLKECGLNYNSLIDLQEKNPHRSRYTAWGSWLSASMPYVYNPKECLLVGYNEQWKKIKKGTTTLTKKEFQYLVAGVWEYRSETKKWTEANFSLDIPINALKIFSYENDLVLDPFIGSGTTAIACEKLNRRWIGIEISEKYCNVAKRRILESKWEKQLQFV